MLRYSADGLGLQTYTGGRPTDTEISRLRLRLRQCLQALLQRGIRSGLCSPETPTLT